MRGVILIHGLTGTPANMAPLARTLSRSGFKVRTPLLLGHGTCVEDLFRAKMEGWVASVDRAYDSLANECDEIYVAGQSLGSLLAINLALDQRRPVKKIACLGTPLRLLPLLEKFLLPISHIPPIREIIRYSKKNWEWSVADEMGREMYKNASYDRIPVPSVWQLQRLQKRLLARLGELDIPAIIVHSRRDKVAPPFNVELFCKMAVKVAPKVIWCERSEHVILLDFESELVTKEISNFFLSF